MLEISAPAQMRGVAAKRFRLAPSSAIPAGLPRLHQLYLHNLAAIKQGKRNLLPLGSLLLKATSHHPPMMKQATFRGLFR